MSWLARAIVLASALAGCKSSSRAGAAAASPIAAAPQLVVAIVDDWAATRATLRLYARDGAGWRPVGAPWPAVIGASGAAWGDGLHGDGAPAGHAGPVKREGDRKSPAGAFALRGSYGYAPAPPAGARLPYAAVDARWECVDDPASRHYATIVARDRVAVDWRSAERMRRDDALYTWVVDVAANPAHVPLHGSCIFFHVWSGPDSATVGCTAMAEPRLAALIAELDPAAAFVLLPRADYDALAAAWGLPARDPA